LSNGEQCGRRLHPPSLESDYPIVRHTFAASHESKKTIGRSKILQAGMSGSLKINLVLLVVAAIVVELFAVVSTPFLENVATAEVLQRARIMMEAAAGIRLYTANEVAPLLNARPDDQFHAQTVPAYAATKNFALLARKFRDYTYREAALNPTNLANRAIAWEADIINDFRRNRDRKELITERETANGRVLNLSHPIESVGACLACHGAAENAPRSMIAAYGTQNGFGWTLNEIIGAQIVSAPMTVALEQAAKVRNLFMSVLTCVFLLLIVLFNLLPILLMTVSSADGRRGMTRQHGALVESIKAFGYGLLAAGVGVVTVFYAVVYTRGGIVGLAEALDLGACELREPCLLWCQALSPLASPATCARRPGA
jgi:hypothetical protein